MGFLEFMVNPLHKRLILPVRYVGALVLFIKDENDALDVNGLQEDISLLCRLAARKTSPKLRNICTKWRFCACCHQLYIYIRNA